MLKPESLLTEIILSHPHQVLGKIQLDWLPQPGNHLELEGSTYVVLERHHHYQYKIGGYHLQKMSLYVQSSNHITDKTFIDGRWVIGNPTCLYNAQSELLRCALQPNGPCQGCKHYQPI